MYKDNGLPKPMVTINDYRKSIVKQLFSQMINNRLDELRNSEKPPFVFGSTSHGGTYALEVKVRINHLQYQALQDN